MPLSQIVSDSIENGAVAPVDLSSVAQYTGFKNRLINGSAAVWQRGTSFSVTTVGLYTADRWAFENANGNTMTVTQQSNSSQLYGSGLYYIQATVPSILSGTSGQYFIQMYQTIEAINIADCAGGNVTLSFTASVSSSSGSPQIWVYAGYPSAMDNWTSASYPQVGTITPSATPTRYTLTIPLSSAYRNGMRIYIGVRSSVATAINSVNFSIGEIQIEKGVTATSFDYRPYGTELSLCQRYYYQSVNYGAVNNTTQSDFNVYGPLSAASNWLWTSQRLQVPMRVAPTVTTSDQAGTTGKLSLWTSVGGTTSNGTTPYSIYTTPNIYLVSVYNESKYGFFGAVKADAEL
jgi:hypothetical protein